MQISRALASQKRYLPETIAAFLLALLYAPLLYYWVDGWLHKNISTEHEYFSHGLIGLPFAAYLCWQNRQTWQALPTRTHGLGLVLLLLAVGLYSSRLPDLINLSLVVMLAGLCLWFKGWPGLRLQGFALLLLLLASPNQIPYLIAPYTLPLQKLIAGVAGFILAQGGMDVRVDQIYLFVNDRIVEVAPYCAGLKMLFTSLYVGLMLLYWTGNWRSRAKVLWFYGGIVIMSVISNIIRNAMLTYFHGTGQDQAFYWLHDSWGGDLYSTLMLGSLVWLIQKIDDWVEPEFELEPEFDPELDPEPDV
ncbi:MAG: cyanoexosortase B [Pegethrix bostrychoides GSE-TBD4-15B]|jgi:cyanoexosortase B|uniref:Cyanoexosortase B n=1 Tax=Pegethrix bostrychoides GSE-TBD4-15B TaxID=2839662 RepID=A0A951P794_9CYAN|nr:cyanoexosortase B [Pegethrix bostrychoides GSE-TBD4-15B]